MKMNNPTSNQKTTLHQKHKKRKKCQLKFLSMTIINSRCHQRKWCQIMKSNIWMHHLNLVRLLIPKRFNQLLHQMTTKWNNKSLNFKDKLKSWKNKLNNKNRLLKNRSLINKIKKWLMMTKMMKMPKIIRFSTNRTSRFKMKKTSTALKHPKICRAKTKMSCQLKRLCHKKSHRICLCLLATICW